MAESSGSGSKVAIGCGIAGCGALVLGGIVLLGGGVIFGGGLLGGLLVFMGSGGEPPVDSFAENSIPTAIGGQPSAAYASATEVTPLPAGTGFVVREVAPDDAYFSDPTVKGVRCYASDADFHRTDGAWWAGAATCGSSTYYFYKAAFDLDPTASGVVAPPAPTAQPTGTYASATTASPVPVGNGFVIREVAADDAYFGQNLAGKKCVAGDGLERNDGAWFSGAATCEGDSYYFYKVAFDLDGAVATVAPVVAPTEVKTDKPVETTGTSAKKDPEVDLLSDDPKPIDKTGASRPVEEKKGSKVSVDGDAKVVLVGGGKRFNVPGTVPAGKYEIEAAFPGEDAVIVGKVTVGDGPVSISCNPRMGICRPQ